MESFLDSPLFNWLILPILIFCARIFDVSISTLRIIYISRNKRKLAPVLGFVEILIWLTTIRQIFSHLNNVSCFLAYALGFATGNFVGMWIEQKLAIGVQVVRIITQKQADNLIAELKQGGFGVTTIDGQGMYSAVNIIFTIIQRKDLTKVLDMIKEFNPKAFFSVEDVRMAAEGIFPPNDKFSNGIFNRLKFERKSK